MKLRLRGFIGIKSGPGLRMDGPDEVTIDFDGREGISTFEGQNGCGKSTVIESLHHYPRFISRGTKLWANCYSRDAEKEFESDFMGHSYRSLMKIDSQTHKMEGFFYVDGSTTSCCPTSISAFEDKIAEIFGKWETFKRAQFSPQRSRETSGDQIENMSPGDFRDILREYLNLQLWDTRSKTANEYAEILTVRAATLDTRIDTLNTIAAGRFSLDEQRYAFGQKAEFLRDDKTILQHDLDEKRATADALKATIQQNALAVERRKDIQAQIDRLEGELAKEKRAAEIEINALAGKYREIKAEIGNSYSILQNRIEIENAAKLQQSLEFSLVGLIAQIEEENQNVPVYQKRCHDLETDIAGLQQQVKDLEDNAELRRLDKRCDKLGAEIKDLESQLKTLDGDGEIPTLEHRVKMLTERSRERSKYEFLPGEPCKSEGCLAVTASVKAAADLPGLQERLDKKREGNQLIRDNVSSKLKSLKMGEATEITLERKKLVALIDSNKRGAEEQIRTLTHDLKNAQTVLQGTNELLAMHRVELTNKRAEITKQKALADRLPEVRIAEERKKDLEKQLAEVTAQETEKKRAWIETEAAKREMIKGYSETMGAILIDDTVKGKLDALYVEIGAIETVKIPAIEKEIETVRDRIATLHAELRRIEAAEKELQEVRVQRETLAAQVARWRYLQNFCGEKGYQAIAVASATPRIIKYANDLLTTAFDVPYTVRLKTQDDQRKEIFKVVILCPDGREVDLDAISGGQRSWAIPPLLLGMSLLSREESGREFDYFCVDEIDGAMSDENKVKCANFYPAFMKLAKLKYLPFITHCEAARGVADHRLVFEAGKGPVWG